MKDTYKKIWSCLFVESLIAGGLAGVIVEAALYPIDTIKTRVQVCYDPI